MQIDWSHEVLHQLEEHWRCQLRPRLEELTDREYFWEPVPGCWTLSRRGESSAPMSLGSGEFTMDYARPPRDREPVTTIAWRLAHLVDVFGSPDTPHFDGAGNRAEVEYSGTAEGALRQLDEGYDAWIRSVRDLGTDGLTWPQGDLSPPEYAEAPIARLVLYTNLEVIHHGAEICLLRDLYLSRSVSLT